MSASTRVGVISDTHGLLRPQALQFLQGCDSIIHCGDICERRVIDELSRIAPVAAVRGNNDRGDWARALPDSELLRIGEIFIYAIHDLSLIDIDPKTSGVSVVLCGHSHKPHIEQRDGVTYLNPGSAGPRRFKLPISVAELIVKGAEFTARIAELESPDPGSRPTPTSQRS
jgi:putative phosphoesterase